MKKKDKIFFDEYNKVFTDKTYGLSLIVGQGLAIGIIGLILLSSFGIINKIFNFYEYLPGFYFVLFGVVAMTIGYSISLRNNKYLDHFEQFDKWSKKEKRRNVVLSFLAIIFTIVYFFLSLMCC